ncbi:polymorphic toxin-type HINT domain-containing protein [Thermoactinomyces sp. DSM 45892]|uniref:polymorphic toxin-type HINT domain-containing protein n=1 Tax=Thermoactinomyces sp. DSM 45892 TaxID=1882753 RepID=UPI00089CA057|nr:polymorphic toxin-type HINT domain-containing protein [Thermoactinomyces sp. DSM 45892]SDZ26990.1 intein N-terminal splicing region [Thermoactinomyces sp. DSM 45892]
MGFGLEAIFTSYTGDKVLAKNEETGEIAYKEVEWLFKREIDEIYEVHIGGEVIQTTDEHPFWVIGEGWVPAKDLRKGDLFETDKGKKLSVDKIVKKKQKATVYNFKVKDFHTYYVSDLKVLTHNRCNLDDLGNISGSLDKISKFKDPDEFVRHAHGVLEKNGFNVSDLTRSNSDRGWKFNVTGSGSPVSSMRGSMGGGRHGDVPYAVISTTDKGKSKVVWGSESNYRTSGNEKSSIYFLK